jgi:hypothetical protein
MTQVCTKVNHTEGTPRALCYSAGRCLPGFKTSGHVHSGPNLAEVRSILCRSENPMD